MVYQATWFFEKFHVFETRGQKPFIINHVLNLCFLKVSVGVTAAALAVAPSEAEPVDSEAVMASKVEAQFQCSAS